MGMVVCDLSGLMLSGRCVNRMTQSGCGVLGAAGGGMEQEGEPYRFLVHASTLAPI
jgi:hypothetical protein